MKEQASSGREKWVDAVKVFACILVVLGHFFQSMTKANILPSNRLYQWFDTTIYYFHVPLFFICSGYLYQKHSRVRNAEGWIQNAGKKAVVLGVPYLFFSTATWLLKTIFSSDVNDPIGGLGDTLLFHPVSPYWFLYVLFFVFLITPTFVSKKAAAVGLLAAAIVKLWAAPQFDGIHTMYVVYLILSNEVWFILGINICGLEFQIQNKRWQGMVCASLFFILSIVVYMRNLQSVLISFIMGLLACTAVILLMVGYSGTFGKGMEWMGQYTMPIFLMHTLFAAPLRSVLLKFGIENAIIHVALGLCISFAGPIAAAWIMRKLKWAEFLLYPNRVIAQKREAHSETFRK